jgi:site-specific recombinase XerD
MRTTKSKTYDQLLKEQVIKKGLSMKTYDTYLYAMKRLIKPTGKLPDKITKDDVHEFQVNYQKNYNKAYSTYRITCCGIRFFYNHVIPRKWAVKCIPYPKTQKRVPVILSRGEMVRLFQHASSEKVKMFMMLAYASGLRMMELRHLKVNDIDGERMVLIVRKGKGKKDREVGVDNSILARLRKYYKDHKLEKTSYFFWGHSKNTALDESRIQRLVRESAKKAKINKKVSPHALRHTFATHFLEYGNSIKRLQNQLGHQSISPTFEYIHYAAETFIEPKYIFEELVRFLKSNSSKQESEISVEVSK